MLRDNQTNDQLAAYRDAKDFFSILPKDILFEILFFSKDSLEDLPQVALVNKLLHLRAKDQEKLKLFLAKFSDEELLNLLHQHVSKSSLKHLKIIWQDSRIKALINTPFADGSTILFHARTIEVATLLIKAGADLNVLNREQETVLVHLLKEINFHQKVGGTADFISKALALANYFVEQKVNLNIINNDYFSAEALAFVIADLSLFKALLKQGIHFNDYNKDHFMTRLALLQNECNGLILQSPKDKKNTLNKMEALQFLFGINTNFRKIRWITGQLTLFLNSIKKHPQANRIQSAIDQANVLVDQNVQMISRVMNEIELIQLFLTIGDVNNIFHASETLPHEDLLIFMLHLNILPKDFAQILTMNKQWNDFNPTELKLTKTLSSILDEPLTHLIFEAIEKGCIHTLKILLLDQRTKDLIQERTGDNNFLSLAYSHVLEKEKKLEMIHFLLENGAPLCNSPEITEIALYQAMNNDEKEIVTLLMDSDQNDIQQQYKDYDGNTFLHVVACSEFAQLLLNKGFDLEAKNNFGRTPLMMACIRKDFHLIEFFIQKGAKTNVCDDANLDETFGSHKFVYQIHLLNEIRIKLENAAEEMGKKSGGDYASHLKEAIKRSFAETLPKIAYDVPDMKAQSLFLETYETYKTQIETQYAKISYNSQFFGNKKGIDSPENFAPRPKSPGFN